MKHIVGYRESGPSRASHVPLPFHGPGEVGGARPRLLLLSYHFPPGQSAGALRWQKMALTVAERGWALDVVTLDPSSVGAPDMTRLQELPPDTRVYGARERPLRLERLEQAAWARVRGRAPSSLGTSPPAPSAQMVVAQRRTPESLGPSEIRWWPRDGRGLRRAYHAWRHVARDQAWATEAGRVGAAVLDTRLHRAVVTCGPPHMIHNAGRLLAQRACLPFVLDLRDPWSLPRRIPEAHASPLFFGLSRWYERRAVRAASLVVTNTDAVRDAMQAQSHRSAARFLTVTNGFDEEPLPWVPVGRRFVMAYAGGIYLDRDPRPLLRAAGRVVRELSLVPADFGVELLGAAGSFGGVPLAQMAVEEGLDGYFACGPRRSRAEALAFLAGARMLVSLPQDSAYAIPSKVFEYMQFDAWLLALAEPESPVAQLLVGSSADVVAPDDIESLARVIRTRYEQHARGERPARGSDRERFSRRHQATLLLDAIEQFAGTPRSHLSDSAPERSDEAVSAMGSGRPLS